MTANTITQDDLWNDVYELGPEGDPSTIAPNVAVKLIALKIAQHGANGLGLTPYRERPFVVLESGNGNLPVQ
jgi:hypothetical protein